LFDREGDSTSSSTKKALLIVPTRLFVLATGMEGFDVALISSTDAIVPVEPRYLETVGLLSVIGKIMKSTMAGAFRICE
jgi:hypothetical protein